MLIKNIFIGDTIIKKAYIGETPLLIEESPILDRLVSWVDGRDGFLNGIWKDRTSNNNDFAIRPILPKVLMNNTNYFESSEWGDSRPENLNGNILNSSSFSICMGFTITESATVEVIWSKRYQSYGSGDGFVFNWLSSPGIPHQLSIDTPSNADRQHSGFVRSINQYYNLVIAVNKELGRFTVYIDGNEIYKGNWTNRVADSNSLLSLLEDSVTAYKTKGRIGYCMIYHKELSSDEVLHNYNIEKNINR